MLSFVSRASMAPGMAVAEQRVGKLTSRRGLDAEELRRRNEELEREVRAGREREEGLRRELEQTRGRLRALEEAEELLCAQLGELEAEALAQAREYRLRVLALSDQLENACRLLPSSSAAAAPPSHHLVI